MELVSSSENFFPQGLALGSNFCNRLSERTQLKNNIASARPTLIMASRRYGKTSLVLDVASGMRLPFSHIDLYSELNEIEVQNSVLGAIGDILWSIETKTKNALTFVTDFFSGLNVSFSYRGTKVQVEVSRSKKPPAKIILEALKKLDSTLKERGKKIILFFDEFQRLNQITESTAIEAVIRQVAQESNSISFIFSGSNRNLLSRLFDDRTKPLFKLCDRMELSRIADKDYIPFIQSKFQKKWKTTGIVEAIQAILDLTERHPYYVNVLCHKIFSANTTPSETEVQKIWHQYAMAEKSNVTNEIDLLSHNQSKMLIAIAKYGTEMPLTSKDFVSLTKFSPSSAAQSIKVLEKRDYIQEVGKRKYNIIDPLIKYIFSENYLNNSVS